MEFLCHCGAEASFFIGTEQKHVCLAHRKAYKERDDVYFNKAMLSKKVVYEVVKALKETSLICENALGRLQDMIEETYNMVNEVFTRESQKLLSSLNKINQIVESFENSEQFVKALNIFTLILDNPPSLISSLKHRVSLKSNNQLIKLFESSLQVNSNLEDLLDYSNTQCPPSEVFKKDLKMRQDLYRVSKNYHPPENAGQLTDWISSINMPRNLANFRTLSISGHNINDEIIEGYSLLPNIFYIKELSLVNFEKDSFESVALKVLTQCKHLKRLQIEDCDVSKQASELIMNSMSELEDFSEIIINDCQAGDVLAVIPSKLNLSSLQTLAFSKCLLADEGIEVVSKLFPKMLSLKYLYLDSNTFTSQGAVYLVMNLGFLLELRDIDLSNNKIGECLGFVFKSLSLIPRLGRINVSSTDTHETQYELILASLNSFVYLESILFDMTLPKSFLIEVKKSVPEFCVVFRDNPEQDMCFEFINHS